MQQFDLISPFHFIVYDVLRWLFIVLDILAVGGLIYFMKKAWPWRPHMYAHKHAAHETRININKAQVQQKWADIQAKYAEGSRDSTRLAIIEADKFVDLLLKELGLKGDTMADRLEKLASAQVASQQHLWRAHRVRNEIVHSADFELSPNLASRTMADYESFLKELKII